METIDFNTVIEENISVVGELLKVNDLWNNELKELPGKSLNKALTPGEYIVGEGATDLPLGFYPYGQLLVFGENKSVRRLTQLYFTDRGEFAYRSRTIPSTGTITDFEKEWNVVK